MKTLLFPNNVRMSRVRGALGPLLGSIFGSKMGPAHETSSLFWENRGFHSRHLDQTPKPRSHARRPHFVECEPLKSTLSLETSLKNTILGAKLGPARETSSRFLKN